MLRDSGTTRYGWLITMIEQPTLFGDIPQPLPEPPPVATCGECVHLVGRRYGKTTYWHCLLIESGELKVNRASIKGDYRKRRRKSDPACCRFEARSNNG